MKEKFDCIVLDDSKVWVDILEGLCKTSKYIKTIHCFDHPQKFLDASNTIHFDLMILDLFMPQIDGISIAKMFQSKLIIFVTAEEHLLRKALEMGVIDVLVKPIDPKRFEIAMRKTRKFIRTQKPNEYASFNVAESDNKIRIKSADIMLVRSDDSDPRNKQIFLRNGKHFLAMNYTFDDLLDIAPMLIKVNRRELISIDTVHQYKHDEITIKGDDDSHILYVTLSDTCRRNFKEQLNPE